MLDADELTRLVTLVRRRPLLADAAGTPVALGQDALERLLPHRPPMLLVDRVDRVDLASSGVRGQRRLRPDDVGFAGHFPGDPVYPGVLVVEAMGQLALTLPYFVHGQRLDVPVETMARRVRATHIHHASFVAPFTVGDTMTLQARVAHYDYTLIALAQAWRGEQLAAFAVCEVFIDE